MDYTTLAAELLDKMQMLRKASPQKYIDEALRGETFVLFFIAMHGDTVLPGEIGNEMNVSSARVAQTLNSIEKKGWITRQIDEGDRRRILVRLTPEGKKAAEKHHQAVITLALKMLSLLGEDDAKEYVRITGKLAEIISVNTETILQNNELHCIIGGGS